MKRDQTANHQRALDARQPDLTVLMDGVTKPHNVSAIIRTADAVGIQQVHTTSTGDLARRNYMSLRGAKHWVAVTTHRSTRAALTALRFFFVLSQLPFTPCSTRRCAAYGF